MIRVPKPTIRRPKWRGPDGSDFMAIAGASSVAVGVGLWSIPVGLVVLGLMLMAGAYVLDNSKPTTPGE